MASCIMEYTNEVHLRHDLGNIDAFLTVKAVYVLSIHHWPIVKHSL